MRNEPLLSSVVWLTGLIWIILLLLTPFYLLETENPSLVWLNTKQHAILFMVSLLSGIAFAFILRVIFKKRLVGSSTKTISCSIGEIPGSSVNVDPPLNTSIYIDPNEHPTVRALYQSTLKICQSKTASGRGALLAEQKIQGNTKQNDAQLLTLLDTDLSELHRYAPAFQAVFSLLADNTDFPASSKHGAHNVSLMHHCFNVCESAVTLFTDKEFKYEGIFSARNNQLVIEANDPQWAHINPFYNDDKHKPKVPRLLLLLTALAHDIGKLKTFHLAPDNSVRTVIGDHGPAGAKMIAMLPAFSELLYRDRSALYESISHYHHPHMIPLTRTNANSPMHIKSDFPVALMMGLIHADKLACSLENHPSEDYEEAAVNFDSLNYRPVTEAILHCIRPTSGCSPFNYAFKPEHIGYVKSPYVYVDFDRLVRAVKNFLDINTEIAKKGKYHLNLLEVRILDILFLEGILATTLGPTMYPHTLAIFSAGFELIEQPTPEGEKPKPLKKAKKIAFKRCILLNSNHSAFGKGMNLDCDYEPTLGAALYGETSSTHIASFTPEHLEKAKEMLQSKRAKQLALDNIYQFSITDAGAASPDKVHELQQKTLEDFSHVDDEADPYEYLTPTDEHSASTEDPATRNVSPSAKLSADKFPQQTGSLTPPAPVNRPKNRNTILAESKSKQEQPIHEEENAKEASPKRSEEKSPDELLTELELSFTSDAIFEETQHPDTYDQNQSVTEQIEPDHVEQAPMFDIPTTGSPDVNFGSSTDDNPSMPDAPKAMPDDVIRPTNDAPAEYKPKQQHSSPIRESVKHPKKNKARQTLSVSTGGPVMPTPTKTFKQPNPAKDANKSNKPLQPIKAPKQVHSSVPMPPTPQVMGRKSIIVEPGPKHTTDLPFPHVSQIDEESASPTEIVTQTISPEIKPETQEPAIPDYSEESTGSAETHYRDQKLPQISSHDDITPVQSGSRVFAVTSKDLPTFMDVDTPNDEDFSHVTSQVSEAIHYDSSQQAESPDTEQPDPDDDQQDGPLIDNHLSSNSQRFFTHEDLVSHLQLTNEPTPEELEEQAFFEQIKQKATERAVESFELGKFVLSGDDVTRVRNPKIDNDKNSRRKANREHRLAVANVASATFTDGIGTEQLQPFQRPVPKLKDVPNGLSPIVHISRNRREILSYIKSIKDAEGKPLSFPYQLDTNSGNIYTAISIDHIKDEVLTNLLSSQENIASLTSNNPKQSSVTFIYRGLDGKNYLAIKQ